MSTTSRADRLRWLWRLSNRLETASLRRLGFSWIALIGRRQVLVLETTGRKTGRLRHTPVVYRLDADGRLYIGGGAGGMTRVDWVANLRAKPVAAVWMRRRRHPMIAHELTGEAYERERQESLAISPQAAKYEQMSGRRVPYFRLDLTDQDG
ncbi:nitroreductase/quinone reductase family protein [Actinoallomurus sp. CA-150999]|uniref:nitroreductase/quinone reductase family protein n=1 Tax=Actinoallomurus sp. CA-150999 TaxID=3239887 RepID=UPI003D916FAC